MLFLTNRIRNVFEHKGVKIMSKDNTVKTTNYSKVILAAVLITAMAVFFAAAGSASAAAAKAPRVPGKFTAQKSGLYNKAKLTWSKAAGAEGYQIFRATKANGKYKLVKQTSKNSTCFINKKLKKKAVYYFKIRSFAGSKVSAFTQIKKVVVKNPITGTEKVTAKKLASYYKKSGHKFPKYYKKTDTPTLNSFCQAYIDEAKAENINAKAAFAQCMLETGWLTFGGSVSISQNNFAGLGAVGGGVKGNKFKTVKIGIRAQIQHLKAYANKKPLRKKCVDKRFTAVSRGCSPYVEWLGIGDNPKHNGWCVGSGYGYTIVKMMAKI